MGVHQSGPGAPAAASGGCGQASPVSVDAHWEGGLQPVHSTVEWEDRDTLL